MAADACEPTRFFQSCFCALDRMRSFVAFFFLFFFYTAADRSSNAKPLFPSLSLSADEKTDSSPVFRPRAIMPAGHRNYDTGSTTSRMRRQVLSGAHIAELFVTLNCSRRLHKDGLFQFRRMTTECARFAVL